MKKIFALLLTAALVLTMCACGGKTTNTPAPTDTPQTAAPGTAAEKPEATPESTSAPTAKPTQKPVQKPAQTQKPTATQKPAASAAKTAGELTSMMTEVLAGADAVNTAVTSEVTKDSFKYVVGIDYADGYTAVVYAPQMSSVAYQVVLFSAPSGADMDGLAAQIKANADPRKWICVSADTVGVKVNGNTVLFYMFDGETFPNTEKAITANFAALK